MKKHEKIPAIHAHDLDVLEMNRNKKSDKMFATHESMFMRGLILGLKILIGVVMAIYCLSLLVPILFMLLTSVKDTFDYSTNLFGLPTIWRFDNYVKIIRFLPIKRLVPGIGTVVYSIPDMFFNTIIRSAVLPLIMVSCQATVTYVMSKYKFVGNNFIYTLGIVVMITPIVGSFPSSMQVAKALGIYDNLWLSMLTSPHSIFGLNFLILYGAFKSLPWEYAEAAFIDGGSKFRVFIQIMLPLVLPTCFVLYVLGFLGTWNDYGTPLVWLPSFPNLAYALYMLQLKASDGNGATTPMIMAGFAVIMIPTVILFVSTQKLIVARMNVGGLKG